MKNTIHKGDCLELMKMIPDGSVDMILCDLPYGTTQNIWDSVIPFDLLWAQYKRIIKNKGAIALTAQSPFDKVLGCSNLKWLKYEWIWEKPQGTGHLNANIYPLKNHENVLIFCNGVHQYNPQFGIGTPYTATRTDCNTSNYGRQKPTTTISEGSRFPKTVLKFNKETGLHPTQKPVALFEYLIKTYTNEGETVLDNCAGSGTTAIACLNTNRNYILMEKEEKYFEMIENRIKKWHKEREPQGLFKEVI